LRPMSGLSAPLTSARIAPVPGGRVCVAYERCASHESDSCHNGHALARGAARQGYAVGKAAIRERCRGPSAGPLPRADRASWTVLECRVRLTGRRSAGSSPKPFGGAVAGDRGFAAGRQVFGAPDMTRQDFMAPCMVIGSVWRDTGVWRMRCRTTGTEGKRACAGQQGQGDGGSPGEVVLFALEARLSRRESLTGLWDLLLATMCNVMGA
jgi:hypothetical protein